jgi:hypothetical protein
MTVPAAIEAETALHNNGSRLVGQHLIALGKRRYIQLADSGETERGESSVDENRTLWA